MDDTTREPTAGRHGSVAVLGHVAALRIWEDLQCDARAREELRDLIGARLEGLRTAPLADARNRDPVIRQTALGELQDLWQGCRDAIGFPVEGLLESTSDPVRDQAFAVAASAGWAISDGVATFVSFLAHQRAGRWGTDRYGLALGILGGMREPDPHRALEIADGILGFGPGASDTA